MATVVKNFATYSDEAVLGLGQDYSQHLEFARFFQKCHEGLPNFLQGLSNIAARKNG